MVPEQYELDQKLLRNDSAINGADYSGVDNHHEAKIYQIHSENIRNKGRQLESRLDQTRDEGISNSNGDQFILLESPEIAATGFELGKTNRFNTLIRRARTQLSPDHSANDNEKSKFAQDELLIDRY